LDQEAKAHEGKGGGVIGDRIGVDSGVLNAELITPKHGELASGSPRVFTASSLRRNRDCGPPFF